MCFNSGGPPYGIPISQEIHDQFPQNVKEAWVVFDNWWQKALEKDTPPQRTDMPKEVATAMEVILQAPIPGFEDATGKDSCYMQGVLMHLF